MDQDTKKPVAQSTPNHADEDLTQAVLATFGNSNFTVSRPIPSSVGTCMYSNTIAAKPMIPAMMKMVS